MLCPIGIEIADGACRMTVVTGSGPERRSAEFPFQPWILTPGGGELRFESIHSRLDPRSQAGAKEVWGALGLVLKQAREWEPDANEFIAVLAVPGSYSVTQRQMVRDLAYRAGLVGVSIVDSSSTAALGSVANLGKPTLVLSLTSALDSFAAAVVEVGDGVCRGRSLEVSSTCGFGGFWLGGYRTLVQSIDGKIPAGWLSDPSNWPAVAQAVAVILRNSGSQPDSTVALGSTGISFTVSGSRLAECMEQALSEMKELTVAARGEHSLSLVYVSPQIAGIPLVARAMRELCPGLNLVTDDMAALVGAARYCDLFPPDVIEQPPPPSEPEAVMGTIGATIAGQIERLEKRVAELEGELSETNMALAGAYGRAAQMLRVQGKLADAWDLSGRALAYNRSDNIAAKAHKDLTLELLLEKGRRHRFEGVRELIAWIEREWPDDKALLSRARQYYRYFQADHYARCKNMRRKAIAILRALLKSNRKFKPAEDLLRHLGGKMPP